MARDSSSKRLSLNQPVVIIATSQSKSNKQTKKAMIPLQQRSPSPECILVGETRSDIAGIGVSRPTPSSSVLSQLPCDVKNNQTLRSSSASSAKPSYPSVSPSGPSSSPRAAPFAAATRQRASSMPLSRSASSACPTSSWWATTFRLSLARPTWFPPFQTSAPLIRIICIWCLTLSASSGKKKAFPLSPLVLQLLS